MVARMIRRVVLGLSLLVPAVAAAQPGIPNMPGGMYGAPGMGPMPGMPGMAGAQGMPAPGMAMPQGMVMPSSYEMSGGYPGGTGGYPQGMSGNPNGMTPPSDYWAQAPSSWSIFTRKVVPNSWVGVDILSWDIDDFGDDLFGAPRTDIDPRLPPDPLNIVLLPNNRLANLVFPFAGDLDLRETPGARFTWGLPLREGSIEMNAWFLGESSDAASVNVLTDPTNLLFIDTVAATSLGTASAITSNIFYDLDFRAEQTSSIWGGEFNVYSDWSVYGTDVRLEPMWGLRFVNLEEQVRQVGNTTVNGRRKVVIDSQTENYLFGPQVGMRMELDWWKFTIGADPRFAATFNAYEGSLANENLRFPGDPSTFQDFNEFELSPMFEMSAYLKFEVNKFFTVKAGYNFMHLFSVTRPVKNVNYNPKFDSTGSVFQLPLQDETVDMSLNGLTIGGEIRFR